MDGDAVAVAVAAAVEDTGGDADRTNESLNDRSARSIPSPWRSQGGTLSWGSPEIIVRLGENDEGYPEITKYRVERSARRGE